MASPAYIWIYDNNNQLIKSLAKVSGREGAIEAHAFEYSVEMPVDRHTGATTGTRQHNVAQLTKQYCPASPILFDAACHGKTLSKVIIKWYQIDDHGKENEYFRHVLEGVKVVSYQQRLYHTKDHANNLHVHEDTIAFRFAKILIKYLDGNIEASDQWSER